MKGKVEELKCGIKSYLKKNHKIKPNIPRDEHQVLREMKRHNTRMVLTADKGVSMVVVDREEYTAKSDELLINQTTRSSKQIPQTRTRTG